MARVRSEIAKGISGMVGRQVVYKQWQGKVVLSSRPKPRKRKTIPQGQRTTMARFKEASIYANQSMKVPELKAIYKKGVTPSKNAAHRVAVSDYLNAPVIHYIKVRPETIIGVPLAQQRPTHQKVVIKATDDFEVIQVTVQLINSDGTIAETGEAIRNARKRFMWKYVTERNMEGIKVVVTAIDRPGNVTKM